MNATTSMNLQPAHLGCRARRPYIESVVVVTLKMYKEAKQSRTKSPA